MTYSILEPSIISISDDDWSNDTVRDIFLDQLLSTINLIDDLKFSKIAWSTNIDNMIWSSPQQPPWKQDSSWTNVINPILYKISTNNHYFDDDIDDICIINPELYSPRADIYNEIKKIIPIVSFNKENKNSLIHIGLKNTSPSNHTFTSNKHNQKIQLIAINAKNDYLKQIPIEDIFWPEHNNCDNHERLGKALHIILERDFSGTKSIYTFEFDKGFLKKLISTTQDKLKILTTIARRLTLTAVQARGDGAFQEEQIGDQYRFRVSKSKRIHFSTNKTHIIFLMYYDEGEHDDGL